MPAAGHLARIAMRVLHYAGGVCNFALAQMMSQCSRSARTSVRGSKLLLHAMPCQLTLASSRCKVVLRASQLDAVGKAAALLK